MSVNPSGIPAADSAAAKKKTEERGQFSIILWLDVFSDVGQNGFQ